MVLSATCHFYFIVSLPVVIVTLLRDSWVVFGIDGSDFLVLVVAFSFASCSAFL